MIKTTEKTIIYINGGETVLIEAYGTDAIRVRATKCAQINLTEPDYSELQPQADCFVAVTENSLTNGKIKVEINQKGCIGFYNTTTNKALLEEYDLHKEYRERYGYTSRSYKHISGDSYQLRQEFLASDDERIYGMGQQPHGYFDQKGTDIELFHHNTVFTIPFYVSSLGYGFIWNNPSMGKASFAKNHTVWTSEDSTQLDYIIFAQDTPLDILKCYSRITGKSPEFPDWALGYWQCKVRYKTQDELLSVAREYYNRKIPLDVIIIDFFHWTEMGDFKFDNTCWHDPKAMVDELREMNIKLMVSVWPTVNSFSENCLEMEEKGYLLKNERGVDYLQRFMIKNVADEHCLRAKGIQNRNYFGFYDATNPQAREYVFNKLKENYCKYGIEAFWLDCNEPELRHTDFSNIHCYAGNGQRVINIYPNGTAKMVYEGLKSIGVTDILSLSRSGWLGVQKYGATLWSGDIVSSFLELKRHIPLGLNVSMSGVPWWNSDIGGFSKRNCPPEVFEELLIRWFQYATFCPVMRMHGTRNPNEIWSYSEQAYAIMKNYILIRENMKEYIKREMKECVEQGVPLMRPLLCDFNEDGVVWDIGNEYMFGSKYLVAPVTEYLARTKTLYLPQGADWQNTLDETIYSGGQWITVDAPLEYMPVFIKKEMLP